MHYVAIRGNSDLSGAEMERRVVGGTELGWDREMVWACTTYAGALFWARARLRQYGDGTPLHVYEAVLDAATVTADPREPPRGRRLDLRRSRGPPGRTASRLPPHILLVTRDFGDDIRLGD